MQYAVGRMRQLMYLLWRARLRFMRELRQKFLSLLINAFFGELSALPARLSALCQSLSWSISRGLALLLTSISQELSLASTSSSSARTKEAFALVSHWYCSKCVRCFRR